MDESDLVALIALLVSLIALLISLTQLLQSSALTAEGWRHCNATNMGQWSVFSRRKWLWSELRCEVRYTTPFIRLMDTSTFYEVGFWREGNTNFFVSPTDNKNPWNDNTERLWESVCKRLGLDAKAIRLEETGWGMVFEEGSSFKRPESGIARAASHILGFKTLPNDIERHWESEVLSSLSKARSVWRSCRRWLRGYHFRSEPRQLSSSSKAKNMSITWDGLLRTLLLSQLQNFRTRVRESKVDNVAELRETQNLSIPPSTRLGQSSGMSALRKGETIFTLDLERRSWDFLPPDITRPLARSTMKTVVILARRLGMHWRTFDLYREQYRAEGNGCSLTATNVRGIGSVFRFDTSYRRTPDPVLCSTCADKAYFGIIPGDEAFGVEDYPLVNDDRRSDIDVLVKALGKEPKELRSTLYFWGRIVVNDAGALLCPFMPLPNSRKPRIFTAIGTVSHLEIMVKLSIFSAFGLDKDLRSELNKRLAAILKDGSEETAKLRFPCPDSPSSSIDTSLKTLFDNHQLLRSRYRAIKENRGNNHLGTSSVKISGASGGPGDQESIDRMNAANDTDTLRKIHDAIRDKLLSQQSIGGLMHLVEAHMKFVSDCILGWYRTETKEGQKRPNGPKNHADDDLSDGWDNLLKFCRKLKTDLKSFRNNLKRISPDYGSKFSEDELDRFWWMLVARGAAWQLSVDMASQNYKDMVPSSVYESEMSVWIE
jgi:hypothetical protein